jgi:ACR3 family arsenite transporter
LFERHLSVWVALCMGVGILLGKFAPDLIQGLRGLEFGKGSQQEGQLSVKQELIYWGRSAKR